jgi:DNA-binding NarL/FixJ family response regulator
VSNCLDTFQSRSLFQTGIRSGLAVFRADLRALPGGTLAALPLGQGNMESHWSNSGLEPTTNCQLAEAWDDLISGRARIVAAYATRRRHFLELVDCGSDRSCPLDSRSIAVLDLILFGTQQKVIAADTKRAASTVSSTAQRAMHALGLECQVSRFPILLKVMHRSWHVRRPIRAREGQNLGTPRIINIFRADACLQHRLSPSEYEVARDLVDGLRQEQIALRRRTSQRTIANQVANVYQKLRVSGRNELMEWLVEQDGELLVEESPIRELHSAGR